MRFFIFFVSFSPLKVTLPSILTDLHKVLPCQQLLCFNAMLVHIVLVASARGRQSTGPGEEQHVR